MIGDYVDALILPISRERLQSYRPTGGSDLDMVVNYFWNTLLCEALYAPLQALEVTLRNSLHNGLSQRFETEAWYDHPDCLELQQQHAVIDAKIDIVRNKGKDGITTGRIISGLSFGFWTYLLNDPYERRLWKDNRYELILQVFPHVPKHLRTRKNIFRHFNELRILRNRVFHFEPIWNRKNLSGDYEQMLDCIGWISLEMKTTVSILSRFPDVYTHGKEQIETDILALVASINDGKAHQR